MAAGAKKVGKTSIIDREIAIGGKLMELEEKLIEYFQQDSVEINDDLACLIPALEGLDKDLYRLRNIQEYKISDLEDEGVVDRLVAFIREKMEPLENKSVGTEIEELKKKVENSKDARSLCIKIIEDVNKLQQLIKK